jgi:predicted amidohydrolase YtcJ
MVWRAGSIEVGKPADFIVIDRDIIGPGAARARHIDLEHQGP